MRGALEQFNVKRVSGWVAFDDKDNKDIYFSLNGGELFPIELRKGERPDIKLDHFVFDICPLDSMESDYFICIKDSSGELILNTPRKIICDKNEICKVLPGKKGWLFLNNDSNHSLEYITGKRELPQLIIDKWENLTISRKERANRLGCSFASMIVPEKSTVYKEFLPDEVSLSDSTPMQIFKIHNILGEYIIPSFAPPLNFTQGFEEEYLYYKGDSHWNYFGAYYAFLDVIENLGLEQSVVKNLANYKIHPSYMSGDLKSKVAGVNIERVKHVSSKNTSIKLTEVNQKKTSGRVEAYRNDEAHEGKRIIVFHTSSIDWMKPFFLDYFRNIKFVWSKGVDWVVVEEYKSDIVFYQTNERFLITSPVDVGLDVFEERKEKEDGYFYNALNFEGSKFQPFFSNKKNRRDSVVEAPKKSPLKIILKAKDEPELIESWIKHHEKIVGLSNLIIIDSGSEDQAYLDILNRYKNDLVILSYTKHYDLIHAPQSPHNVCFYEKIMSSCHFVTILDADELLFFNNDNKLSYDFNESSYSNSEIICGTWLHNASLPKFDGRNRLELDHEMEFYVDTEMLDHGTVNGKSIMPTGLLPKVKHLGHNLVAPGNLEYISKKSIGKAFILHISNLGSVLTKRRVAAHLAKAGITDEDLLAVNSPDQLLIKMKNKLTDMPKRYEVYAEQYFKRNLFKDGNTIKINIAKGGALESDIENLTKGLVSREFVQIRSN